MVHGKGFFLLFYMVALLFTDRSTRWMRSFGPKFELFPKYLVSPVIY